MRNRKLIFAASALLGVGCGTATLEVGSGAENDQLGSVQHRLDTRLKEQFGKDARVQRVFGLGNDAVLGIALGESTEESDVRVPLALANYRKDTDALTVISATAGYKEARVLGASTALVTS